ncbi:unnamed protein product [Cochlearia groenlandica]
MAREQKEEMVIKSSIILLQERFKQLQRARELRAERELVNFKPKEQDINTLQYYNSESPIFGFFQFLPINSQTHSDQSIEKPNFCHHWSSKQDKKMCGLDLYDDVDTSLRL